MTKNQARPSILNSLTSIFLFKKITEDFWYSFFKNIYTDILIFTDDIENVEKVFKSLEKNVELIFYDQNPNFEFKYSNEAEIQLLFECFVDFIDYNTKFIEVYSGFTKEFNVDIYLPKASNQYDYSKFFPSRNSMSEIKDNLCLSYYFDQNCNYSQYKKVVFLVSTKMIRRVNLINEDLVNQEMVDQLISVSKSIDLAMNQLCTYENFSLYLKTMQSNLINQIVAKTSSQINHFPYFKQKECYLGDVSFPIESSRLFLDHIIYCIRKIFEKSFIFLKSIIATASYLRGGFLNKEYQAAISLPGIFDFKVHGYYF
jgi:hypothetical protein